MHLLVDVVIPARNAAHALPACLRALAAQELPAGADMEVIVVDDASSDDTAGIPMSGLHHRTRIITNATNRGRSATRNIGLAAGSGDVVVFLDSDCCLTSPQAIRAHLTALQGGAGLSISPIRAVGSGFWSRYGNRAAKRRRRSVTRLNGWMLTTACAAGYRRTLEHLGGFDERFTAYGFEDRDLLLRAIGAGCSIVTTSMASVSHDADVHVAEIVEKMRLSAARSAPIFAALHPRNYSQMQYAQFDIDLLSPCLARAAAKLTPLLPAFARSGEWLVRRPFLPFWVKAMLVAGISGFAYFCGSTERSASESRLVTSGWK